MALVASTCITQIRLISGFPAQTQGRWSDTNLLPFVDMAQKHLVQELLFPESRLIGTSIPNQELYPIPDAHRLYRVYLNGQICVEVFGGIDTLEGRQIGQYDTTGQGTSVAGSDAAQGGSTGQPQWAITTPQVYPYLANLGAPAMTAPAMIGAQGRYYRRTGNIGFWPTPSNASQMTLDGVFVPPDITQPGDTLEVPVYYLDALCWYVLVLMAFSDTTQTSGDSRNFAQGMYTDHLKKLRTTIRQYKIEDGMTLVRTDRSKYAFGRNRNGYGWGGNW